MAKSFAGIGRRFKHRSAAGPPEEPARVAKSLEVEQAGASLPEIHRVARPFSAITGTTTGIEDQTGQAGILSLQAFAFIAEQVRAARRQGAGSGGTKPAQLATPAQVAATATVDVPLSPGSFDDTVRIEIQGETITNVESYDVHVSVFTQPASFTFSVGHAGALKELLEKVKPRKQFKLFIGNKLVQTGFIDGWSCGGVAATASIMGRDTLQDVHDSYTDAERSFTEKKHLEFVKAVLAKGVFKGADEVSLSELVEFTDDGMRTAMATGRVPLPKSSIKEDKLIGGGPIGMRLGDRYFDFIKRILDRSGLFMYASPEGKVLITAPNKDIKPMYRLVHAPTDGGPANVVDYNWRNSAADRAAKFVVYGRGGGRVKGSVKFRGGFVDDEMYETWGYNRVHTFRDWHIQCNDQAQLMARRKIAEYRRRAWQLSVVVAGHTTTDVNTGKSVVWRPDTMAHFASGQLKVEDLVYIEDVRYQRSNSGTTTALRLMRPEDLVFGYEEVVT
jgi:prophage tail gpP-like protein